MPLPSSGPLSLSDIQTEFGGSNPIGINEYYAGGSYVPAGTSGTYGAVPSSGTISIQNFYGTSKLVPGQQAYTSAGTYTWVAPTAVTSVSVVAIGGGGAGRNSGFGCGGGGGGGGGLGYKNNYSVTPGNSYTVVVGAGQSPGSVTTCARDSYFISRCVVKGGYGGSTSSATAGTGGTYTGTGGGNGGAGGKGNYTIGGCCCYYAYAGGGGAGGYSGTGGTGAGSNGPGSEINATAGAGGGGGGGGMSYGAISLRNASGGGGTGILGQGSNGAAGCINYGGGGGGSGGGAGQSTSNVFVGGCGGNYGGGAGSKNQGTYGCAKGSPGAVRIIWPGTTRYFPSTCTGNK